MRVVLYNYLCFEEDKSRILRSYSKSLNEYYSNRVRGFFIFAEREIETQIKDYAINGAELGFGDEISEVELKGMEESFTDWSVKKIHNEGFDVVAQWGQYYRKYFGSLSEYLRGNEVMRKFQDLFNDLGADVEYLMIKLPSVVIADGDRNSLADILAGLLKIVIEDVTKRLTNFSIPFIVIQLFINVVVEEFGKIRNLLESREGANARDNAVFEKFRKNVAHFQFNIAFAGQANVLCQYAQNLKVIKQHALQQEQRLIDKMNLGKGNSTYDLAHQKYEKDYLIKSGELGIYFVLAISQLVETLNSLALADENIMG